MRKIQILHISSRADFGGGPKYIYTLQEYLLKKDKRFVFHYAIPQDYPFWDRFSATSNNIIKIPHRKLSYRALLNLKKYVAHNKIDIIHSHGRGAGLYAFFLKFFTKAKILHTSHGINIEKFAPWFKFFYKIYEKIFSMVVNKIVFVSETECNYAYAINLWPYASKAIVNNCVPTISDVEKEKFRSEIRKKLNLAANDFVVIVVARFDSQKNINEAYEIAKTDTSIRYLWLADKKVIADYLPKLKDNNLNNIDFVEFNEFPYKYISAADLILNTSFFEGLSLSILEGLSVGLPFVVSDVMGNNSLPHDFGAGFLYKLGDINQACSLIKKLILNRELYSSMALSAKKAYKTCFSIDIMCTKMAKIYEKII